MSGLGFEIYGAMFEGLGTAGAFKDFRFFQAEVSGCFFILFFFFLGGVLGFVVFACFKDPRE